MFSILSTPLKAIRRPCILVLVFICGCIIFSRISNTKTPDGFNKLAFDNVRKGESLWDDFAKVGKPYYGYKNGNTEDGMNVSKVLLPKLGETLTFEDIALNSLNDEKVSLFYSTSRGLGAEFTRYILQFERGRLVQKLESIED